ncbi:NUDIX domain-containing protein [Streptomyces sp. 1222.5]|uniref:NUDIX domain-containing protein n=1 Tax=Streptomyces sp. 1222.5 TaxID=1881026 RepID=UPI003D7556B4
MMESQIGSCQMTSHPDKDPYRTELQATGILLAAAGAIFTSSDRKILLVKPSYKPKWEIPGGCMEAGESPLATCVREVREELSISPPIGRLLLAEWVCNSSRKGHLLFLFDGGMLAPQYAREMIPDGREVVAFKWFTISQLGTALTKPLAQRVIAGLGAREAQLPQYRENGESQRSNMSAGNFGVAVPPLPGSYGKNDGLRCTQDIGKAIRERRMHLGMKITQLSECTGLTVSFLSRLEEGKISVTIPLLCQLAATLEARIQVSLITDNAQGSGANPKSRPAE